MKNQFGQVNTLLTCKLGRNTKIQLIPGHYTNEISEAHETIPIKVDENGNHLSHNLTHHHYELDEKLRLNISIFEQEHHLVLVPSVDFLAPNIQIEWRGKDKHVRRSPRDISRRCHYQGVVHGDDQSRVALSACNGLVRIDYMG